ncbi:MAG: hypothetical protein Q8L76_01415, partial [Cypionkella sp.]|nr:hypothetical protein [Cypionkella sp.]
IAAGFGSTGIAISGAGAFATNIITAAVAAEVVGSDLTASAGVSVTATSTGSIKASVMAASAAVAAGSTGIGASIGVAVVRNIIGFGTIAANSLTPTFKTATDRPTTINIGNTVHISEGGRAGQVFAYRGTTAITKSGGVDLSTMDYANTDMWEEISLSRTPAGISALIMDSDITASGAVLVSAISEQRIDAAVFAGSAAVGAGSVGVGVSGAGVGVTNKIASSISAVIDGGTIKARSVSVLASDDSLINAAAHAVSLAAGFGQTGVAVAIGVSVAHNVVDNDVLAKIDGATLTVSGSGTAVSVRALTGISAPTLTLSLTATNLDDAAKTDTNSAGTALDASDVSGDTILRGALKTALLNAGETVSGNLRVSIVEAG